jgi:hypothetical protein
MIFKSLLTLFSLPFLLQAGELQPWFGKDKEFEFRADYTYQTYSRVARWSKTVKKSSDDSFITASLAISPTPDWSFEIEETTAHTSVQTWDMDNTRLTVRYLVLDDILGDPVSLVLGISCDATSKKSRRDVSSFHHGNYEYEAHVSIGKELSKEQFWTDRFWGVLAYGVANKGSPWLHFLLAYDNNYQDLHQWRLFVDTLWGFGGQNIRFPFHGYGPIHHQSIDIGARYSYLLDLLPFCNINFVGTLNAEIAHRFFARNCPYQSTEASFMLLIPFGI